MLESNLETGILRNKRWKRNVSANLRSYEVALSQSAKDNGNRLEVKGGKVIGLIQAIDEPPHLSIHWRYATLVTHTTIICALLSSSRGGRRQLAMQIASKATLSLSMITRSKPTQREVIVVQG